MQVRDLEFGFDIYLVLNISTYLVFFRLPVLADQDEARQENSFQRNDHRQQSEGEWIEGLVSEDHGIERDPNNEPESMRNKKGHAAAKPCEPVGDPLQDRRVHLHLFVNIARDARAQQFISLARQSTQGRQHVQRRFWFSLKQQDQITTIQHQDVTLVQGQGGGRARPSIEHR